MFAPPVNQVGSSGLSHEATVYYQRLGLDKLKPNLHFQQICTPKPHPKNSGRTGQFYRFTPGTGASNTVPAVDGVVGSPIPLASQVCSYTVEEYNDFTSSSQLLEDTDIAPFVEEMVEYMSDRGSITADTLARLEIDSLVGNSTVGIAPLAGATAAMTVNDFKAAVTNLAALNVKPHTGQDFMAVIHPWNRYDIVSDNTAGGFIDALKYQNGMQVLNGEIGKVGGCRILETTNVGTDSTASPNQKYYTYIFGYNAVGAVALDGSGPSQVQDPNAERFQTFVTKGGPSAVDPAGTTGTYVAYRFVTAFKVLYTANDQYRYRIIKSDPSRV
jgi:N4-gp56 family major capsid protein